MRIILKDTFLRCCDSLTPQGQASLIRVLLGLSKVLGNPGLHGAAGLRKLHPSGVWEVRVGLSLRALFLLAHDEAIFLFLGSHDEVKRFLRQL